MITHAISGHTRTSKSTDYCLNCTRKCVINYTNPIEWHQDEPLPEMKYSCSKPVSTLRPYTPGSKETTSYRGMWMIMGIGHGIVSQQNSYKTDILHGYSKKHEVFVNITAFDLVTLVQHYKDSGQPLIQLLL